MSDPIHGELMKHVARLADAVNGAIEAYISEHLLWMPRIEVESKGKWIDVRLNDGRRRRFEVEWEGINFTLVTRDFGPGTEKDTREEGENT